MAKRRSLEKYLVMCPEREKFGDCRAYHLLQELVKDYSTDIDGRELACEIEKWFRKVHLNFKKEDSWIHEYFPNEHNWICVETAQVIIDGWAFEFRRNHVENKWIVVAVW